MKTYPTVLSVALLSTALLLACQEQGSEPVGPDGPVMAHGAVHPATVRWDAGGDGGSWSDPSNWDPNGIPSRIDHIIIDNGSLAEGFATVLLDIDFTLDPGGTISIDFPSGGIGNPPTFVIRPSNTLTNKGLITNNYGLISVESPGSDGGTIDNFGTMDNFGRLSIDNSGTVTNKAGGTVTNHGIIDNNGIFENECASTFNDLGTFNGTFDDLTCFWDGGGDGSKWSDPLNWGTDALPSSTDDIVIDDGVVTTVKVVVHLDIDFSLDPGGTISVNFLSLGIGAPTLVVDDIKTLTNNGLIENSASINNLGTINNPGTITNNAGGTFLNNAGGSFTNEPTGTINIVGGTFRNECGSTFNDFGTIGAGAIWS